jgi:hypothetical protein
MEVDTVTFWVLITCYNLLVCYEHYAPPRSASTCTKERSQQCFSEMMVATYKAKSEHHNLAD